MLRRLLMLALLTAALNAPTLTDPAPVSAAPCVRLVTGVFDSPGPDTRSNTSLNAEWVRIKNFCSTTKSIGSWRIHDYGKQYTYRFGASAKIGAGKTITLHTGKGSNTAAHRYWGRTSYVWNNTCPEKAYLRNASGSLVSTWSSC